MPTLPKTLSALLRLALADLEAVEQDPAYRIDMDYWHQPTRQGVCHVCLAGAVMAKTLEIPSRHQVVPGDDTLGQALFALNALRLGRIIDALDYLDIPPETKKDLPFPLIIDVPDYATNPQGFKATLGALATTLVEQNL